MPASSCPLRTSTCSPRRACTDWPGPPSTAAGLALAGTLPGEPLLRARQVPGGYVFDGCSPWVTGWGLIDTLYTAARDADDNIIWALLDARPAGTLSASRCRWLP
jgi:hypothetical protein